MRRQTLRLRLTLLFAVLFLIAGAALLLLTYAITTGQHLVEEPAVPGGVHVVVPRTDIDLQRDRDLQSLLRAEGAALAGMTLLAGGLGWLVADRALRPLRTMAGAARQISERNLHQRLALSGPRDEVKDLADTFDGLLGRLQGAFEAQRRFVANASHELRTPLTVERSLLEVALADPDADLRHTCERVLAQNRQQERLIEALLTLARSQRGLDRREPVDLAWVVEGFEVAAELHPAPAMGDRPLIERLVGNLIDNAARHNVPGGWIRIWTGTDRGWAVLRVVNSGPPVVEQALFEPFRKGDGSAGLGIGLSIVAAIVTAHDGQIEARARAEGGLDVVVRFPPAGR
ncbi:two-component sensor histidine kinase [Actinoplanes ianthinogenes]|uniref:histidine kinase n=1 Tax=Actinoplanes ianthinogenes TaxID=122358 RepID=A0ABM7LKZ0_9ACTN|nr:ATP-binding protein [Actinoplanes ianthinogenes]BCJ39894.1 two-component sensor histidine kinase [Actinoplanes ianthinogenes]GGR08834.1 two-component sensor histidine kinase [Actinoplanes ianthinogenes]